MKFHINYSEKSFERYMSRKSVPNVISKVEKIVLRALKDHKINTKKIPRFNITFRHGKIVGDANVTRYPENKNVELTINVDFAHNSSAKAIKNIVYHELGHLKDILDPKYRYSYSRVNNMSEDTFLKFTTVWNISIDSRLNKKGLPSCIWGRKEDGVYFHIPKPMMKQIWGKSVSFSDMLKMARKL